jgi:hypothetical protein
MQPDQGQWPAPNQHVCVCVSERERDRDGGGEASKIFDCRDIHCVSRRELGLGQRENWQQPFPSPPPYPPVLANRTRGGKKSKASIKVEEGKVACLLRQHKGHNAHTKGRPFPLTLLRSEGAILGDPWCSGPHQRCGPESLTRFCLKSLKENLWRSRSINLFARKGVSHTRVFGIRRGNIACSVSDGVGRACVARHERE